MNATSPPTFVPSRLPQAPAAPAERQIPAVEIDASCRGPLLFLFVSATLWLVFGLFLGLISSIKLHAPGFLAHTAWLTIGRVRPASINAILYGFASQAAFGVLLWMLCRLGRTVLSNEKTLSIATVLWNLGVTLGIIGILAGGSTGFEWLEMPGYASPILFIAYTLIGIRALAVFYARRERSLYVSQWYLLAALFWFPWIYSAANLLLVFFPVRGVVQSIVNAWFTSNFLGVWLTSIGLGILFYFIPKLSGRPLYNQNLAAFGFWTFAFFASWTGPAKLVGGPVPAWMISTGIAASVLLLVPIISVALNWRLTLAGFHPNSNSDVTWRFMMLAAVSYLASSLMGIVLSFREVSAVTHLTCLEAGQTQLAMLGFVAMALFGSINYIVPRMMQLDWPSVKMVQAHFWCSAVGIGLVFLALSLGGIVQGFGLNNPAAPFINVVKSTIPFLGLSTLGQFVLLAGQVSLLVNLILLLQQYSEPLRKSALDWVMRGGVDKEEVRS